MNKQKRKKGQNFIEFVFVFPLLIMFLFGIVELAFFWKSYTGIQNLANQMASNAANYAYQGLTDAQLMSEMSTRLEDGKLYKPLVGPDLAFSVSGTTLKSQGASGIPPGKIEIEYNTMYLPQGVIDVQVRYLHETALLKAEYALPNGRIVTLIPSQNSMQSSWVRQYFKY